MRTVLVGLTLIMLAACTAPNTSFNRLQLSGDTTPFPEHYQAAAASLIISRGGNPETALVSYPKQTLSNSAFGPQRWYACVRSLPAPTARRSRLPTIEDAVAGWLTSPPGHFDTILFFSHSDRAPAVRSGFDSPLCASVKFGPITVAAPV